MGADESSTSDFFTESSLSESTSSMKRLGKRTKKDHIFSITAVERLLNSFGHQLTKKQLEELEDLIVSQIQHSTNSSPIFSKGNSTNTPTKPKARLFKFKNRRTKKKERKNEAVQPVHLREIEICQQIGCGASSAGVYMCIVDGWSCAMKQLKREHVGKLDIKCFEREMDILYQLPPHPNIVRYLFHTSIGPDLCLFMQLYGGTLRDYLDERRIGQQLLDVELIAEMALEIATGIQFLHKHGVIHRDIKAGNIFITKNGKGEITNLAVGDFDTSLRIQATASVADLKSMMMTSSTEMMVDPSTLLSNVKDKRKSPAARRNQFAKVR